MDYIASILPTLLSGLKVTAEIFFLTIVLSLPLGVLLAIFRVRSWKPIRELVAAYIYVMRGTPLMLQILFIYYGLPLIPGVSIQFGDFTAALIAFVANYAAYFAEIFRGGIQNISRGQYEGAKVLGFTYPQTMRHIILPQVVKRVLAPVGNETITLLKDTSLVYVLAMDDLMRLTRSVVQRDFDTTAFFVAGVIYLVCTFFLTKILTRLEKHFAVYDE
ncbi:MAG: amino acid ABC transporter permease [Negativicoccus succinicivorans]|uniref:amino acid ABC transporter permease n=1 Tax=Negativicoccus succinicivorans TaxID=620903 RepID=UPI0029085103|nr:amino acid ABC transporter permease [Negativicoccus succinicivorans]MDU4202572.1 amino acid ABC transporter permease [Negativicoccus succinicivorans]MDU5396127.1 amino acid ABC transporter permease [Negativicoccus succinicivorans]